jgi:hypothetical protein
VNKAGSITGESVTFAVSFELLIKGSLAMRKAAVGLLILGLAFLPIAVAVAQHRP